MGALHFKASLPFVTLSGIFLLSFFLPIEKISQFPLCLFQFLSHLDCPGCGLTRSIISISHGQFIEALRYNALGPVVYLFLALLLIQASFRLILRKTPFALALRSRWTFYLFALLFWGQWILKLAQGWRGAAVPLLS